MTRFRTRNSSGRNVDLLNESTQPVRQPARDMSRDSSAEAPYTPPELQQTASYDSSPRSGPITPTTPTAGHDAYPVYAYRHYPYHGEHHPPPYGCAPGYHPGPPAAYGGSPPTGYEDELAAAAAHAAPAPAHVAPTPAAPPPTPAPAPKRYPCRLREEYGCTSTFTTSGHASRHSKIHTSEKGVQCTWPGCEKKFTRADNMKQHRDTHTRDKTKRAPAQGHARRASHTRRSSLQRARQPPPIDTRGYGPAPLQSPSGAPVESPAGAYDLAALRGPLPTAHPVTPAPGLDALFHAAHRQGDV